MGIDNYPILEVPVNASLAGDNIIIAGIPGKIINIFQLFLVLCGDTEVTFKDGALVAFDGPLCMVKGGSIVFDFMDLHWFRTSDGNDFVINLSAPVNISGRVYYTQHSI